MVREGDFTFSGIQLEADALTGGDKARQIFTDGLNIPKEGHIVEVSDLKGS